MGKDQFTLGIKHHFGRLMFHLTPEQNTSLPDSVSLHPAKFEAGTGRGYQGKESKFHY